MTHAYPAQLASFVCQRWGACAGPRDPKTSADLPDVAKLEELLSIAYQASLLKEEERPVTFRLILGEPMEFPEGAGPPTGLQRLLFTRPRSLNDHELRRLSPAAKYHRALIGVRLDSELGFVIWGILQSGARWLRDAQGGRRGQSPVLPSALVINVNGPGRLALRRGTEILGELQGGVISRPSIDVFQSRWLAERFADVRGEYDALHAHAAEKAGSRWAPLDENITRIIAQQMFKRVIATMRSAHHGGLLVILPPDLAAGVASSDFLRAQYSFADGEPRRRYRTLILNVMNALAEDGGRIDPMPSSVGWSQYETSSSNALGDLDEAIFELSRLIAGLADVDGAVVMTRRFELLGFGAEIRGNDLPDVLTVQRALDLEGDRCETEATDSVGTRHRSAYRLCQRVHDALAVVASQDGGIRFVAWKNGAVTCWDHLSGG
jgi:hypothetical protein